MPAIRTTTTSLAAPARDREEAAGRVLPDTGSLYDLRTATRSKNGVEKPRPTLRNIPIF